MRPTFVQVGIVVAVSVVLVSGQTKVTAPANKYTPAQDVQLGLDAAKQAREQLPVMNDMAVSGYVAELGRRLVAAIPPEFQRSEFKYTFETVNVREINAFALPGGPMFVNRGMIEAAKSEGQVAGVMAHEISHVVLRHGTAQASKATKYEIGTIAGAIAGAIIGGKVGSGVAQATQFGLGTAFMRFSRAYEKDADLEGAQIMARAGYDAREMANMFKTIEAQGSSGPEFLSDHPALETVLILADEAAGVVRGSGVFADRDSADAVNSDPEFASFNDAVAALLAEASERVELNLLHLYTK